MHATILDILRVQGTSVVVGSYVPPEVDLLKVEFKELTLIGTRSSHPARLRNRHRHPAKRTYRLRQRSSPSPQHRLTPRNTYTAVSGQTDAIKMLFQLGD